MGFLLASHPFLAELFFFFYIYKNIWTKLYYLLYNINNKIFAFLLLSLEVMFCNPAQVQRVQHLDVGNRDFKSEHRLLNSVIWLCGYADGDGVCVLLIVYLHKSGRSSTGAVRPSGGWRKKRRRACVVPVHRVKIAWEGSPRTPTLALLNRALKMWNV